MKVEEVLGSAASASQSEVGASGFDLCDSGRAMLLARVLETVDSESVKLGLLGAPLHEVLATQAYAKLYLDTVECGAGARDLSCDTLIVGAGFSGILVALGLSQRMLQEAKFAEKDPELAPKSLHKICLLDAKGNLGGRLTFGWQTEAEGLSRVLGGFSIDLFGSSMAQVADKLLGVLDSFEKEFLLDWILHLQDSIGNDEQVLPHCNFAQAGNETDPAQQAYAKLAKGNALIVRKELTPVNELLSGPSECLSRAASQALAEFLSLKDDELRGRVAESEFWKHLKKSCRDELEPFFKTLVGDEFQKADSRVLHASIENMFGLQIRALDAQSSAANAEVELTVALQRALVSCPFGLLCLGIEWILRSRGVQILLNSRVSSIHVSKNSQGNTLPVASLAKQRAGASAGNLARASKIGLVEPGRSAKMDDALASTQVKQKYQCVLVSSVLPFGKVSASRVVVAVPLAQALAFVPRELFSPSESRFVMKTRPRSLVALEIDKPAAAPEFKRLQNLASGGKLFFPVERVLGVKTSAGKLILFSWIDYEISLHAPGVREVLGRLKRAFRRIFNETDLETFSKYSSHLSSRERLLSVGENGDEAMSGLAVKKRDLGERLLLIPVAQSVPAESSDQHAVATFFDGEGGTQQPVAAATGKMRTFWFAGEQYENSVDAWKSAANSAMAIVSEISISARASESGSQTKSENERMSEPLRSQATTKGVHHAVLEKS